MPLPIAEELAKKQKEISVAEFFEQNKQLLGFDSPTRAILTCIKEGVDNSLDACEEANILPDILVEIRKVDTARDEYLIVVEDNGPGIVKQQIGPIFGKLLYGSRFHAVRQSRGQQGIGISAAVMYSQLTTGKPTRVISKIGEVHPAYQIDLIINTKKNTPEIINEEVIRWEKDRGTRVEMTIRGRYIREKKQSVLEYLRSTAIVNPHAKLTFIEPDGNKIVFMPVTDKLPRRTLEIKPHPQGIELGTLLKMAKETKSYRLSAFLVNEFSRVSYRVAREICERTGVDENTKPKKLSLEQARGILDAFKRVKLMAPPMDCLSPIGDSLIRKGLKKEAGGEFITTSTRPPNVYSGNPFQVEAGLVYAENLSTDSPISILRYANRVPLLYQQGGCAVTHAIERIDWRRYGLEQKGGSGLPLGPVIVLVHVASTKVPFTSESKEAIADVPEIQADIELALRDCARKMLSHIKRRERLSRLKEKEEIIRQLLPMIAEKSATLLNKPVPPIDKVVAKIMNTILIEAKITYNKSTRIHEVALNVLNYTPSSRKFSLYSIVPPGATIKSVSPKLESREHAMILHWQVKRIRPGECKEYKYSISGLEPDDYEEPELYVKDIDPELIHGADLWDSEVMEAVQTRLNKYIEHEKLGEGVVELSET